MNSTQSAPTLEHALARGPRNRLVAILVAGLVVLVVLATISGMLLPLLVIVGAGILSLAFVRWPARLLYFAPLLLGIEYRVELGFFSFTLAELCAVLVWIVALLRIWNNQKVYLNKAELLLVGLVAIMALPGVLLEKDTRHALSVYRDFIIPLVFLAGFLMIGLSREQIMKLLKLFVIVATLSAILGIVQYRTGQYLWTMRAEDAVWQSFKTGFVQTSAIGRLLGAQGTLSVGLYATTNDFASYLVIPALLAFVLATLPSGRRSEKLFWKASSVLLFVALLFTFSRGSLFTFLAALFFLVWFRKKRQISLPALIAVGSIGALVIGLVLLSGILSWDQLGTLRGRGVMFQAGIELAQDHPEALITGGFMEEYLTHYYQSQLVHNLPLYAVLQFGLLAALGWLCLVGFELYRSLNVIHAQNQEIKSLGLALFGGVAATVLLYAQTTSLIDSVQSSLWLFFWVGIGVYLHRAYRSEVLSWHCKSDL